jgi:hypothetical protein
LAGSGGEPGRRSASTEVLPPVARSACGALSDAHGGRCRTGPWHWPAGLAGPRWSRPVRMPASSDMPLLVTGRHQPRQCSHLADHHGRQPRATEHQGVLRPPLRSQPHRALLWPSEHTPAQLRRRPPGERGPAPHRLHPATSRPTHPGVPNAALRRARAVVRSSDVQAVCRLRGFQPGQTGFPYSHVIGASVLVGSQADFVRRRSRTGALRYGFAVRLNALARIMRSVPRGVRVPVTLSGA